MNYYALRLTLPDTSACDTIDMLLKALFGSHILTGHEYSRDKVEHTHNVICTPHTIDTVRNSIKKLLKVSKRADSNGNTIYSLKKVTNLNGAVQYAMKCGDVRISSNFPQEPVIWARNNPWKFTFDKKQFVKRLKEIDDLYLSTALTDYEYVDLILIEYSNADLNFNLHQLKSRWLGLANKRNSYYALPDNPPHTVREHLIWNILRI